MSWTNLFQGALIIIGIGAAAPAAAQEISGTISGGVSKGDYGSSRDTKISNVAIGAKWTSGDTSVAISLPYVNIHSPGVVFSGFDSTPLVMIPDLGGKSFTRDGIGDPTITASHIVRTNAVDLTGTARVKIPVQSYNDISTGEVDWSVSGEISKDFAGITPFAAIGYRWFGNPELWNVKDGFSGSAGVSVLAGPGAAAVSYEFAESTSDFVGDSHEIVAVYDAPVGDTFRLATYGTVGLSDGAKDLGVGLRLAMPF